MTFRTIHKQLKEDLAKAKADVEKTEKDLADAKHGISSKGAEVSTLKEQVKCVLGHLCLFAGMFGLRMWSLVCAEQRHQRLDT
jgi:hypothetical protein